MNLILLIFTESVGRGEYWSGQVHETMYCPNMMSAFALLYGFHMSVRVLEILETIKFQQFHQILILTTNIVTCNS